jgi:hypothetical protein
MSNSEQIKGNWNELKGKLKQICRTYRRPLFDEEERRQNVGNYSKN